LKVKQFGNQPLKPGDHVVSTIKKLTPAKISSTFLVMSSSTASPMTDEERLAETVYNSLQKLSPADLKALKDLLVDQADTKKQDDFSKNDLAVDGSDSDNGEEEIARQIKDIQALEKNDKGEGDMDVDANEQAEDSDEQEM